MMKFAGFQPTLFEFLEQLADNNNRPWFQEHKWRYERDVLKPALSLHPHLPASTESYFPVLCGQRPSDGRLTHASLPRHPIHQGRQTV